MCWFLGLVRDEILLRELNLHKELKEHKHRPNPMNSNKELTEKRRQSKDKQSPLAECMRCARRARLLES